MFNRKTQRAKRHLRLRQRVIGTAEKPRMSICVTNRLASLPGKARLLGDAIPAESYATGRNPVPGWGGVGSSCVNKDMTEFKQGTTLPWVHGFLKDSALYYINGVFIDVVNRMKGTP